MSTTTVATGTTEADTTPQSDNLPWTISFDMADDEHCFGAVSDTIDQLPDTVRTAISGDLPDDLDKVDYYDLRQAVERALAAAAEALDDDEVEGRAALEALQSALEDVSDDIEPHRCCQCGLDTWDAVENDWFTTAIAESVDTPSWATFDSGDKARACFTEAPTVREMWRSLNTRDGWDSVTLSWDPARRRLDFTIGSSPSTWSGYLIALTSEQHEIAQRLHEVGYYIDEPECLVVSSNTAVIEMVLNLWPDDDAQANQLYNRYDGDPADAITALTKQLEHATPVELSTLAALSQDWTQSLDELLATGHTVANA